MTLIVLVAGCGDGSKGPSERSSGPSAAVEDDESEAEPGDSIPVTRVAFDDLVNGDIPSDIEQVMAFSEGGDDPCYDTYGPLHEPEFVRLPDFQTVESIEIGRTVAVCFGDSEEITVRAPDGSLVDLGQSGNAVQLLPGDPTGPYTATGRAGSEEIEVEVPVIPAEEPFVGSADESAAAASSIYLVGFHGTDSVPLAVYEGTGPTASQLVGTISIEVDELGQGFLHVTEGGADGECVTLVAEPERAVATASYELEGATYLEFNNPYVAGVCS